MKIFFTLILMGFLTTSNQSSDVYICVSKTASKYHLSSMCKGLKECTHEIKKVTLKEANQLGYKKQCGWEK